MPTYCSMFTKESRKAAALWNQRSQDQDQDQILSDNGISAIMLNIILTIAQYSLLLRLSSSSIASDMAGSCSSWVQHRALFKRQKWSIFRGGTSLKHALRRPTWSQKWSKAGTNALDTVHASEMVHIQKRNEPYSCAPASNVHSKWSIPKQERTLSVENKYNKKVHHSLPLLFITMFVD